MSTVKQLIAQYADAKLTFEQLRSALSRCSFTARPAVDTKDWGATYAEAERMCGDNDFYHVDVATTKGLITMRQRLEIVKALAQPP